MSDSITKYEEDSERFKRLKKTKLTAEEKELYKELKVKHIKRQNG
jgi:hypothetical protein